MTTRTQNSPSPTVHLFRCAPLANPGGLADMSGATPCADNIYLYRDPLLEEPPAQATASDDTWRSTRPGEPGAGGMRLLPAAR